MEIEDELDKLAAFLKQMMERLDKIRLYGVSDNYCGEHGRKNMKDDIKEIMHACGDEKDFFNLIKEVKEELEEDSFDSNSDAWSGGFADNH